jgi:hypothetical protein
LTDPTLYETIAVALALDTLFKHPKMVQKVATSSVKAVSKTASKVIARVAARTASRITEGAAMKAIPHVAEAAGVRAARAATTRAGSQAAIAASTGPAAPFVEAAEIAFTMFTGYMDSLNLGGFANMSNMEMLNSFRDTVNEEVSKAYKEQGAEWPVIFGPFDQVSDFTAIQEEINAKQREIYGAKLKAIQDGWANGTRPKLPAGSTGDAYVAYFDQNINLDETFTEAERQICVTKGGVYKKHPNSSNMYCTWDTAAKCTAPWPLKGGSDQTYYEFNKTTAMCEVRPGAMRQKCESMGLDVTYNIDTGTCNLTDKYCRRYGADNGLKNGDCSFSKGEEIAETIFGRTFVRSIVNIFDQNNYAPCPPGNVPNPLSIIDPGSLIKDSATPSKYLCANIKCADNQDNVNGICYDKCPDGFGRKADSFGNKVNGMCYKCPDGYNASTAGLCHRDGCDADKERGTGVGIGFCYPKCEDGRTSDGATLCLKPCPSGYDTLPLTCQRNPKTITDSGVTATCPSGWNTSVAGPGGMCEPPCPTGQKKMGAICYDGRTDKVSYLRTLECNNGGTKTGPMCVKGWFGKDSYTASYPACADGYVDAIKAASGLTDPTGTCWARIQGTAPIVKPLMEVGSCASDRDRVGGMCYKRCTDSSWGGGASYVRSAAGSCLLPADTISRDPKTRGAGVPALSDKVATTVGPQAPKGVSYHVFPRPRSVPFPSTSQSDFKNSTLGKYIQDGINSARNGDIKGLGKAMAASSIVGNPLVVGLGAQDLVDLGVAQA